MNETNPRSGTGTTLAQRLSAQVLVCDGAMGTMLHAAGASLDRCLPELNLTQPELVESIHRDYVRAGADIIETNSFGANRQTMRRFGSNADPGLVNRRAVELARRAARSATHEVLVAGSVAPAAAPRSRGATSERDALDALLEQCAVLEEAGVDLLMFETFGDLAALAEVVGTYEGRVPVVAHVTFSDDGRTIGGDRPERVAEVLTDLGVAAIGANCTLGPRGTRGVIEALSSSTTVPLSVQPNAGPPTIVHGRFEYRRNEEYFARAAAAFVELGAGIVGGCCGTTPRHIETIVRQLRRPSPEPALIDRVAPIALRLDAAPRPVGSPVSFADRLASEEFLLGVEVPPPDIDDASTGLDQVGLLCSAGADAVLVSAPLPPRDAMHPISFALLVRDELGIDAAFTAPTHEKSILGLQADLIGAHALGLRALVCTTGVPPPQGDYPDSSGVFEVSSVELIETLVAENQTRSARLEGRRPTEFVIGARVSPSALDRPWELERARRKLAAGVDFLITDAVFSLADLAGFLEALRVERHVPVLVGIVALSSFEHAEYLHYEVPGVTVPDEVLARLRAHPDAGWDLAIELARGAMELAEGAILVPAGPDLLGLAPLLSSLVDLRKRGAVPEPR